MHVRKRADRQRRAPFRAGRGSDRAIGSPLAYVACAFHNYKRLLDFVKSQVPLAVIRKGKRKALVRLDADPYWQGVAEGFLGGRPLI